MMLTSPFWGALADRYGRKPMVARATYGGAILVLMMGFARTAEDLIILRIIQGAVTGVVSSTNALVASAAPRERTGFAMGMIQVSLWAGVAVGPIIGGTVADAWGYRMAFIVTAVLLLLAGILVTFGVEENFTPRERSKSGSSTIWADWQRILKTEGVALTYLLRFLSNLARTLIIPIAPLFVATLLVDSEHLNTFTGLMLGIAAAASTATSVYLGRLGDRIGHRPVLYASALFGAIFYFPQSLVTEAWQLFVLQAMTGEAAGGILPTLSALLARYTKPGDEGSVYGLDNSIGAGARAAAPLIGAGVATYFGYRGTFVATGLMFLLIFVVAIWRLPESHTIAQTDVV
jgi:DHA1 family multidrug resistance protein-like MFS transporter